MSGVILNPRGPFRDDSDSYDEDDSGYYGPMHHGARSPDLELRTRDPMAHLEEEIQAQSHLSGALPDPDEPDAPSDKVSTPNTDLRQDTGLLYSSLIMTGVAVLLPLNAFEMASDYYKMRFPDYNIIFDIHMAYLACNLVGVLFGNLFVETIAFSARIIGGISTALGALLFVTIFDMLLELFSENKGYEVTLAAVGFCAIGTSSEYLLAYALIDPF